MRELILSMSMSLDGFIAGADGDTTWIFSGDQEGIARKLEIIGSAGLHIMGSETFTSMSAYFPTADTPFAALMNGIPKAVFSRQDPATLKAGLTGSWGDAYVAGGNITEEVARLKAGDGEPILAHGGAAFARSLIAHDLVDRYELAIYPLVLGKGLAIFNDVQSPRKLELVSSRTFPLGGVSTAYRPIRP